MNARLDIVDPVSHSVIGFFIAKPDSIGATHAEIDALAQRRLNGARQLIICQNVDMACRSLKEADPAGTA